MAKKKKTKVGRPKMGLPLSVVMPEDMRDEILSLVEPGESITALVRTLLREALAARRKKPG